MADYKNPIVIFGAGATKACGGPLTAEILPDALKLENGIQRPEFVREVENFLKANFHLPRNRASRKQEDYPSLPLLISLIDMALDRKQGLGRDWPHAKLERVRHALDYVIFALLDNPRNGVRDYYRSFLRRLTSDLGKPPTIVSLNYDIMADNSLIRVAKRLGKRETFPDYGCEIATPLYRSKRKYGALYKLHGSLNWMYCPGCHRLDLGVSNSGRSTAKVLEDLYLAQAGTVADLEHRYKSRGGDCPDCQADVKPVMIAPAHRKDYRNPHIAQVWYRAERALQSADHAFFIGYGLLEDDVDVIYLLKRGLAHLKAKQVTVVEFDPEHRRARDHPVGRRYCNLFGGRVEWVTTGFADWLETIGRP